MKTTPTAPVEVLLGFHLHVMPEAEALAGIYTLMCNQQGRPKTSVMPKNLTIWSMNPSYRWGLIG